ncbi:MAG: Xaa-Pro peptidase family protein [Dehalococcoidia bacterium]|nr:Xaa-Pro peptidase family protein [Dehalococcoidia bacterium]
MADYMARCARTQSIMTAEGVDAFLVSPSSDLLYLSGCTLKPSERMTVMALRREGRPSLIVPSLEASNVSWLAQDFDIRPWAEPQDPSAMLREILDHGEGRTLAVSSQLWAIQLLQLQGAFPGARFVPGSQLLDSLRIIKDAEELELMAAVSAMGDGAFEKLLTMQIEGLTEAQVAARLGSLMMDEGFESLDFRIVGSGENGAIPHHSASERRIEKGDPIVLDFGGAYKGYFSDMTRTIHVGQPSEEFRKVYEIVLQAQEAGIAAIHLGADSVAVDAAARDVIEKAGYGEYFIHRTGHGVGLDVHEEPPVGQTRNTILKEGMVFSVEPGIYLPGRFGVRIEDVVALTSQGVRVLSQSPRELICV